MSNAIESIANFTSQLENAAKKFNITLPTPTDSTVQKLKTCSPEDLATINNTLRLAFQINIDLMAEYENVPEIEIDVDFDIKMLKAALRKFDFMVGDSEIFKLIGNRDVIEIYDNQNRQLYRSFSFFKLCGYSVVELLLNDWSALYSRPEFVANKLFDYAKKVLTPGSGTIKYDFPTYLLTERYLDRDKAFNVDMQYISPLLDVGTKEPVAYINTFRAETLSLGTDRNKISWI